MKWLARQTDLEGTRTELKIYFIYIESSRFISSSLPLGTLELRLVHVVLMSTEKSDLLKGFRPNHELVHRVDTELPFPPFVIEFQRLGGKRVSE
jgi:hypothetical protein